MKIIRCPNCDNAIGKLEKESFKPFHEKMRVEVIQKGVSKIKCRKCAGITLYDGDSFTFSSKETNLNILNRGK